MLSMTSTMMTARTTPKPYPLSFYPFTSYAAWIVSSCYAVCFLTCSRD